MVLFLSLRRRDQPYFGEEDFHSCSATPCVASQSTSCFHSSVAGPRAAATSSGVGRVVLPMKAFGVAMLLLCEPDPFYSECGAELAFG